MATDSLVDRSHILGYPREWVEFGLLDTELLNSQLERFENGEDQNCEHYRYQAFLCLMRAPLADALIDKIVQLAELDPDDAMSRSVLVQLVKSPDLSPDQFDSLALRPELERVEKYVIRERSRRNERALIETFVIQQKRERYLGFLARNKLRGKFTQKLYHFSEFEPATIVDIAPSIHSPDAIEKLLVQRGAPVSCYVVSTDRQLDQQTLLLRDALEGISEAGGGHGTILSCISRRLAFYEGGPRERCLLVRG